MAVWSCRDVVLTGTFWPLTLCLLHCRLLITFANNLHQIQAGQNVGPDLDPKMFDTLTAFLKDCFENVDFENTSTHEKLPNRQRVKISKEK